MYAYLYVYTLYVCVCVWRVYVCVSACDSGHKWHTAWARSKILFYDITHGLQIVCVFVCVGVPVWVCICVPRLGLPFGPAVLRLVEAPHKLISQHIQSVIKHNLLKTKLYKAKPSRDEPELEPEPEPES